MASVAPAILTDANDARRKARDGPTPRIAARQPNIYPEPMLARSAVPALVSLLLWPGMPAAEVPAVPQPDENPVTEAKRVLGKILFWEEQLSADDSIACGTCHRPAAGGADPRRGRHPGSDPGTIDDVAGSPGIRRLDRSGHPKPDPIFGEAAQVTPRSSQSFFGGLWAGEAFWDGRAGGRFLDPLTGAAVIESGGALENQALTALANDAEMASEAQAWQTLTEKLARASPLSLATRWPADVSAAIEQAVTYPALFESAFGDPAITPVRIAFALASYERTLVADQTAWDRFRAGDETALTAAERYGWEAFQTHRCTACHEPPLFTNDQYLNIGLRRFELDAGRAGVTGDPDDAGGFRVPTLRNAALKPRFMHTGEFTTLGAAVGFYRNSPALPGRDDLPGGGIYAFNLGPLTEADLVAFIRGALVDPRVAEERFPFDRPTLQSERDRQRDPDR